jgi:hypothetical protein
MITCVGIVADQTLAFPDGPVEKGAIQPELFPLVAFQAQALAISLESEGPDQPMGLVASQTFILGKRLVLSGAYHFALVVAFLAFPFFGEPFAFLDLAFGRRSSQGEQEKKRNNQQGVLHRQLPSTPERR